MNTYIDLYISYLENESRKSKNTVDAYRRDINQFHKWISESGITNISLIGDREISLFIESVRDSGMSSSTVSRKLASVRSYITYLCDEGVIKENPAKKIKAPGSERRTIEYLSVEEVAMILDAPDASAKGKRDRAVLELMYGTGMRATEVAELRMSDINMRFGFLTCSGQYGKARIIPLGKACRNALEIYLNEVRDGLLGSRNYFYESSADKSAEEEGRIGSEKDEEVCSDYSKKEIRYVFLNYQGEKLTRQGLWKIVKAYAEKAGIDKQFTPQILRNSFAVHMIQNGADIKSIQELMGYEDSTAVQMFMGVKKNRIKEVFDKTHPRA